MTDFRGFKGDANRLDDFDLPRIGSTIGVGEDELHAFMDVEAAGSGFDSLGRPKMLFEPHLFYRNLGPGEKRNKAVAAGLAYPSWRRDYPPESYSRLAKAIAIDEDAALKSASWGLTQILGSNHLAAGYQSPQAMVSSFMADEAEQLEATVRLMSKWGIDDDMRELREIALAGRSTLPSDAIAIARVWNGPAFAKNGYHTKIAAAHNRWRKIADTPWTPSDTTVAPEQPEENTIFPTLRRGDGWLRNHNLAPYVRRLQTALKAKNLYAGKIDGAFGDGTKAAVIAFQKANGLAPDGVVGSLQTWPALLA